MQVEGADTQREEQVFKKNKRRYITLVIAAIVGVIVIFLTSLCVGNYKTSVNDVFLALFNKDDYPQIYTIVVYSRMPRLIA